jgi:thiamine biosynthesis lipoprotein
MDRRLAALVVLSIVAGPARAAADTLEIRGRTMGTTYTVKVVGGGDPGRRDRVEKAVSRELATVTALMSTWETESELSRFNRFASTEPFALSRPTLEVLRVAREVSELTAGAFDVTVGPIVDAWGFGATDRAPAPPEPAELERARRRVGYRLLELDAPAGTARKRLPDVVCDLSAIAKGDAVDRVTTALARLGHRDAFVEIGGDLRASGRREDGRPWRVAIERPVLARGSIERVVEISDLSMATSGDYRNYYESGGRRFSHVVDPRTGRPIAHDLASVTVVHPRAARADALATGLLVLGAEEGLRLAEARRLAAYFIVRQRDGGFRAAGTAAFQPFLAAAPGDGRTVVPADE